MEPKWMVSLLCVVVVVSVIQGKTMEKHPEYRSALEDTSASVYHPINSELFSGHYVRPTTTRSLIPYFPNTSSRRPQDISSHVSREDVSKQQTPLQRRSRYSQSNIYPLLIPVKFDVNPDFIPDQKIRSRSLPSEIKGAASVNPPRLIMDKDFNIRFDNPYVVPLTKPLAFVLDSSVAGRVMREGDYRNKMMIPFPVLVQARQADPEKDGYRDNQDEGVPEHRGHYDDENYPGESLGRNPSKKGRSNRKPWMNSTYSDVTNPKHGRSHEPNEEDFNESSEGPSVYPSKIFEDMYRSIPKFHVDSQESRERPYDDTRRKYSKDTSPISSKEPNKQKQKPTLKVRPTTKYSFGGQPVFSASNDLEWVTHPNSMKNVSRNGDKISSRIIIEDAEDEYSTTTTNKPLQVPEPDSMGQQITTFSPSDVKISEEFWRKI